MIARIFILLLLLIVLPDLYIGLRYFGYRLKSAWWRRLLWWLQCFGMVAYTVCLASLRNFVPDDLVWIDVYLLFIGIWAVPKAVFALCSSLGLLYCRLRRCRRNVGSFVGLAAGIIAAVLYVYGTTVGFSRLEIRHVDIKSFNSPMPMWVRSTEVVLHCLNATWTASMRKRQTPYSLPATCRTYNPRSSVRTLGRWQVCRPKTVCIVSWATTTTANTSKPMRLLRMPMKKIW